MRVAFLAIVLLLGGVVLMPIGIIIYLISWIFDPKFVVMGYYSKVWAWWIIYGNAGCSLKIEGKEHIKRGKAYVVVANHNSMNDIVMGQLLPLNFRWVSKREVFLMPIFGWVLFLQRSLTIRRGNAASAKKMIADGVKLLKSGVSIAVFPEGTRSRDGKVGEFKPGAFLMASSADVEVLPVMLYNSKKALNPKLRRVKLRVEVLPPRKIEGKISNFAKELNELYRAELDGAERSK